MNRYNIFYQVHKGLRELLYNTASRLQQTDFTNAEETAVILKQTRLTIDLFDKHAATEDSMILPAIQQYEPSVSTVFSEEHVKDHELGEKLRSILKGLQESASQNDKNTWGVVLRPVFIEFMVFNLEHMAKEEEVLNRLLWRYYSDEELHAITEKIITHQQPEALQQFTAWMLRGLSNNEIIQWIKQVGATAPEFIFQGLVIAAEQELPAARWALIRETIRDGAIAA